MITVAIGHRGTGKTELLKRLQFYLRDTDTEILDLDALIVSKIGKSIRELFMEHGETYFREVERQSFLEAIQNRERELFMVLGAGFDLSVIPDDVKVLWVRRVTDHDGRIFLDRPRLDPEVSPIAEYCARARTREEQYKKIATQVYLMPEGEFENRHRAQACEQAILTKGLKNLANDLGGILTVLPEYLKSDLAWSEFLARFENVGVEYFELRDDLLSKDQIKKVSSSLKNQKLIYSFRNSEMTEFLFEADNSEILALPEFNYFDWALELGPPSPQFNSLALEKKIISSHAVSDAEELVKYSQKVALLKWAPSIANFSELEQGHRWWQKNKNQASFLPRSEDGRWLWYRCLQKNHQRLNFWKEGEGSAPDQPSLWQWLMTPPQQSAQKFAAVLGSPIKHSFSPLEHSDFFAKKELPFFAIHIERDEWGNAFQFLTQLGLSYACVTSPHKENAAKVVDSAESAVNTLFWNASKKQWQGTSSDNQGFEELIEGSGMLAPLHKDIAIWGGGGVLEAVKATLPQALYFSSRTGTVKDQSELDLNYSPKVLIWAAPRTAETRMPPPHWKPAMIYDLNYKEDSMGKDYAQLCGANYQSGLVMFRAQAQGQRAYWSSLEETL